MLFMIAVTNVSPESCASCQYITPAKPFSLAYAILFAILVGLSYVINTLSAEV